MLFNYKKMPGPVLLALALLVNVLSSCGPTGAPATTVPSTAITTTHSPVANYTYRIVNTYPHDRGAFTEGLIFSNGYLYESTGLYGQSSLRKVELTTGKVLQSTLLSAQYFGEGLDLWQDSLIQLTWQTHVGFVYSHDTFTLLRNFKDRKAHV